VRSRAAASILAAALLTTVVAAVVPTAAVADGTTMSTDPRQTAWNPGEPDLSPSSVGASDFGQVFDATVDGSVYAQPLADADSVYVSTEKANAYALDRTTGATRWSRSFGTPFPSTSLSCGDLTPYLGSTSTGVIDAATRTWYVTTKLAVGNTDAAWWLQAVSLDTGLDRPGFPVKIQGSPTNDPTNVFPARTEQQRPGLLLMNGVVYLAFGAHCDIKPYKGYVVGVSASDGHIAAFWTAAVGANNGAGIWQSGGGLASDGNGRIFLSTGNGFFGTSQSGMPGLLGESIVRLKVNGDGSLSTDDWFTPSNAAAMDLNDQDLGAGAPTALPDGFGTAAHPHLLIQQGKDGRLLVLDRDDLGGYLSGPGGTDRIVSSLSSLGGLWGHNAFFGAGGGYAYQAASGGPLRALAYGVDGTGVPRFSSVGTSTGTFGYTSGSPIVTSDGTNASSGVVWIIYSSGSSGNNAELRAYDAVPSGGVLTLRWHAPIGVASKFSQPVADRGRVFVGTRDGHVKAFGRPQTVALSTTPVEFGSAPVGSTVEGTATVTATTPLTITAITTTDPFHVTLPTLPTSLAASEFLSLPVSFSPIMPTDASASVTVTTDVGTFNVALHGLGTASGVASTPDAVAFGNQPVGLPRSTSIVVRNTGTEATTVTGVTPPAAPFSVTGAPALGATIGAGASVTIGVTYLPTAVGADSGAFTLATSTGSVTVPLSGNAVDGTSVLLLTPTTLDFGTVTVGQSSTLSFAVSNGGNLPLTITKAKAPSQDFFSSDPLAEGLVIGESPYLQQVTFAPTSAGAFRSTYLVTGDDGNGPQYVTLVGRGTTAPVSSVPSPILGGWRLNGASALSGADLVLTPAKATSAGSAVYPQLVSTDSMAVRYTTSITGGDKGADGLALELLDPAFENATALGAYGSGLGFGGLHGVAVTTDTFMSPGDPSGNFTGIATGDGTYVDRLTYVATATLAAPLRNATHSWLVTYSGGVLSVAVDGVTVLTHPQTLPNTVLIGFSGGTGGRYDTQSVRNVSVGRINDLPPIIDTVTGTTGWKVNGAATAGASSVRLTPAVANVAGSAVWPRAVSTANLSATFTATLGSGTGAEGMTFALLDTASSTSSSLGAAGGALGFGGLAGTAITLDTYKTGTDPSSNFVGIATSIKGGPMRYVATTTKVPSLRTGSHKVVVTSSGGHLMVAIDGTQVLNAVVALPPRALPAFTAATSSRTDVHTVSGVTLSARRSSFAGPVTGTGWARAGVAAVNGSVVALTGPVAWTRGSTFMTTTVPTAGLHVRYTATISPGTGGAEGMALALLTSPTSTATSLGGVGWAMGFGGLTGFAVASDSFQDVGDPGADFVGISTGRRPGFSQLAYLAYTPPGHHLTVGTHVLDVWYADGRLYVAVDGIRRLGPPVSLPSSVRVGFTAATGGRVDTHVVRGVTVASG